MGEHFKLIPADIYKTQMIVRSTGLYPMSKCKSTLLTLNFRQKCFWASVPIYQTSLLVTKMSILFQYRRVFSTPRMRLACNLLIAFLAVYGTWTVLSAWANCVPLAKFWDPSVPGFCFDKKALWFSNSAIHILTDLLILIYPMPVLKSLQLPRKQKFALMGVFALGGLYVSKNMAFYLLTSRVIY